MANKNISDLTAASAFTGAEIFELMQGGSNKQAAINGRLKTYFDSLYWPLGGTADLTSAVTIDGNDFDLIFGSPNRLDEFEVYTNLSLTLDVDDGIETSSFFMDADIISLNTVGTISWYVDDGAGFSSMNAIPGQIDLESSDGVNSSSFSLTPTSVQLSGAVDVLFGSDGGGGGIDFNTFQMLVENQIFIGSNNDDVTLSAIGVKFAGKLNIVSEISPGEIQADQNNYNPTNNNNGGWFRLTSDASRTITGWVPAHGDGELLIIVNVGSNDIVFSHQNGSSAEGNRFILPGATSLTLSANETAIFIYDPTTTRWRLLSNI